MDKKIQLFLLPYAGGSSFSFMKLLRFINPCVETITVEYAGRGSRKDEGYIDKYDEFLDDVVSYISAHRTKELPYAILGYSMGSTLAFDICADHRLDVQPEYCFFCAEGSLMIANSAREYEKLTAEEFKSKMLLLGGLDERMLEQKDVLHEYLNLIKRDFNILGQFTYKERKAVSNATIIYSPQDESCQSMEDWDEIVDGKVDYYKLGNNHFFVNQCYREMAEIVNDKLLCGGIRIEQ